ncbi:unnamed protein product [Ectocarpus sp. CCAP 1310/34]|nr:unnamed protein product [Ectocarpus sp. CCAP 1310/34]
MATRRGNRDAGRLILTNATPFLWKRSLKTPKGMKGMGLWSFPEEVDPGESVEVGIAFSRKSQRARTIQLPVSGRNSQSGEI